MIEREFVKSLERKKASSDPHQNEIARRGEALMRSCYMATGRSPAARLPHFLNPSRTVTSYGSILAPLRASKVSAADTLDTLYPVPPNTPERAKIDTLSCADSATPNNSEHSSARILDRSKSSPQTVPTPAVANPVNSSSSTPSTFLEFLRTNTVDSSKSNAPKTPELSRTNSLDSSRSTPPSPVSAAVTPRKHLISGTLLSRDSKDTKAAISRRRNRDNPFGDFRGVDENGFDPNKGMAWEGYYADPDIPDRLFHVSENLPNSPLYRIAENEKEKAEKLAAAAAEADNVVAEPEDDMVGTGRYRRARKVSETFIINNALEKMGDMAEIIGNMAGEELEVPGHDGLKYAEVLRIKDRRSFPNGEFSDFYKKETGPNGCTVYCGFPGTPAPLDPTANTRPKYLRAGCWSDLEPTSRGRDFNLIYNLGTTKRCQMTEEQLKDSYSKKRELVHSTPIPTTSMLAQCEPGPTFSSGPGPDQAHPQARVPLIIKPCRKSVPATTSTTPPINIPYSSLPSEQQSRMIQGAAGSLADRVHALARLPPATMSTIAKAPILRRQSRLREVLTIDHSETHATEVSNKDEREANNAPHAEITKPAAPLRRSIKFADELFLAANHVAETSIDDDCAVEDADESAIEEDDDDHPKLANTKVPPTETTTPIIKGIVPPTDDPRNTKNKAADVSNVADDDCAIEDDDEDDFAIEDDDDDVEADAINDTDRFATAENIKPKAPAERKVRFADEVAPDPAAAPRKEHKQVVVARPRLVQTAANTRALRRTWRS